ncbi:MAG: hypothetical protein IPI17_02180 [Nitrosomonas sp.]|jgi:hypothetical protein|nr:hypothetical protein [Nitrosomonas sp.]
MKYNAETLAAAHIKIRTARAELKQGFEEQDRVLEDQLMVINEALLAMCNDSHMDSMKTKAGTVIRSVQTRYMPSDWEAMKQFIKDHDALDLVEKRLNQGNMAKFLEDHPGIVPIGLNTQSKYTISVRKPTNK